MSQTFSSYHRIDREEKTSNEPRQNSRDILFVALMISRNQNNRTFNLTFLHGVDEPIESVCGVADEEKEEVEKSEII